MSHELTITNGFAEFSEFVSPGLTAAWHGLGVTLDHAMTSAEALREARLDWKVEQEQMGHFLSSHNFSAYMMDPTVYVAEFGNPWSVCVDNKGKPNVLANVRGDNGLYLGNVTDHYKVVQNQEAFSFMDSLVDDGSLRYESAFSLSGGKRVVLLAQMPGAFQVVKDDYQVPYILMTLNHSCGAIKLGPCSTRVICQNTLRVAITGKNGKAIKELSIGHKGNIKDKLEEAKNILMASEEGFQVHNEKCVILAQHRLDASEWLSFLNLMCPELDKNDPDFTDRRANALAKTRDDITSIYKNEETFSAWAALNAFTFHIDHLERRGSTPQRKAEVRFNVCLSSGAGVDMKERAFFIACSMANCV